MLIRMDSPLFTVFTPTYNRRHTLEAVFDSLQAQTDLDFEWVIVDDGSDDGSEALFERFVARGRFPVRWFRQPNSGKHVAVNRGVREARGALFLILDSDDRCVPDAIARFRAAWFDIPEAERDGFSGVCCHCVDEAGNRIGAGFGAPVVDAFPHQLAARGGLVGEKWGFQTTDVMRRHPYPEYRGEKSIPDSIVWDRIAARYKLRFIDEALRIYQRSPEGWIAQLGVRSARSPNAYADYHAQRLAFPLAPGARFKALANQVRYCLHAGRPPRIGGPRRALNAALLPAAAAVGFALWIRDRLSLRAADRRAGSA